MTITEIVDVSKAKSKIYIDSKFAFVLYKGELRLYQLRVGSIIEEDTYDEIQEKILPKRAKGRCLNLLKNKDYTEKQLRDKLKEGYYSEKIIEEAIAYIRSYHYIDDEKYALQYAEYHLQNRSRRRIENDLQKKGIERNMITQVFLQLEENGIVGNEMEQIEEWLCKKHYSADSHNQKEKQKLFSFLLRKGFSADKILRALKENEYGI